MHNNKRKIISTMLFLSVIAAFITGILLHPFADIHALKPCTCCFFAAACHLLPDTYHAIQTQLPQKINITEDYS